MENTNANTCNLRWIFLLVFICVSLFCGRIYGQNTFSAYEISYQFQIIDINGNITPGNTLEGLLLFYGSNSPDNVIRVRFKFRNDWAIIQWNIVDSLLRFDGQLKKVWFGKDVSIINFKDSFGYTADNFVLSNVDATNEVKPISVFDKNKKIGKVLNFKSLKQDDLTFEYLEKYKWGIRAIRPSIGANTDTLHLVQVTCNVIGDISSQAENNSNSFSNLFTEITSACGIPMKKHLISGNSNFKKSYVENVINSLNFSSNSVVIFYYSGHGFRFQNQKSQWPNIDLRINIANRQSFDNSLMLDSNIYIPLYKKKPRLLIVVGECCNTELTFQKSVPIPHYVPAGGNELKFDANLSKRLLSYSGTIIIATSKPGQTSYYGEKGGLFGIQLRNAISSEVSFGHEGDVSWSRIIDKAIYAMKIFVKDAKDYMSIVNPRMATDQEPIVEVNIH
jgi:hypothetical protein